MAFCDLTTLKTFAAGAILGGAITAAGVYHPSVIIGQMKLEDFHMLKVFLTATATSAIVIPIANYFKFSATKPYTACSIGWFSKYDANIMGGALLGVGMALTGACPGTVLSQIATGLRSGLLVGIGGILGAMLYTKKGFERSVSDEKSTATLDCELGINDKRVALLCYQVACGAIVAGALNFKPGNASALVPPVVGGLLVGASQAASLLLTGRSLGVSEAYEQAARYIMWTFSDQQSPRPETRSTVFVGGVLLGSWALSRAAVLPTALDIDIGTFKGLLGGGMLIYRARMAQGCTSGHGISGMSQLSVSSFITVAAMFGTGIFTACAEQLTRL